jgi:hypothetical protein
VICFCHLVRSSGVACLDIPRRGVFYKYCTGYHVAGQQLSSSYLFASTGRRLRRCWLLDKAFVALGLRLWMEMGRPWCRGPILPELDVAFSTQRALLHQIALVPHEVFYCDGLVREDLLWSASAFAYPRYAAPTFKWSLIRCLFLQSGQVIRIVPL